MHNFSLDRNRNRITQIIWLLAVSIKNYQIWLMIALLKIFILWKLLHGDLRLLRIFMFYQLRTNCERHASCTKSITFTNNNLMRHLISSFHNIFLIILHIYDYDIITWIFIGAHFLIRFWVSQSSLLFFFFDFIICFDNYFIKKIILCSMILKLIKI